ncbi:MAG: hypothetical protein IPO35_14560 [Uliginosibacterium sp.]|jgi:hypothetical protein|nr:hypothetical protein [Uliginosibacterium sp.]MBK9616658.1 hypothetical protein [Uliginosibacterium sp.]
MASRLSRQATKTKKPTRGSASLVLLGLITEPAKLQQQEPKRQQPEPKRQQQERRLQQQERTLQQRQQELLQPAYYKQTWPERSEQRRGETVSLVFSLAKIERQRLQQAKNRRSVFSTDFQLYQFSDSCRHSCLVF